MRRLLLLFGLAGCLNRGADLVKPGDPISIISAVHFVNCRTRFQLNLICSTSAPNNTLIFTNRSVDGFDDTALRNLASSLKGYTLLESSNENVFTLVSSDLLESRALLNPDRRVTLGFTNTPLGEVAKVISQILPFQLTVVAPQPLQKGTNGPINVNPHWSTADLQHLVSLNEAPRPFREILMEVYNSHFKSYWIMLPTPRLTATNAAFLFVHRPEDALGPMFSPQ